jgi:hypothetical protein
MELLFLLFFYYFIPWYPLAPFYDCFCQCQSKRLLLFFRVKAVPSTHKADGKSVYLTNLLKPSGNARLKKTLQATML